MTFWQRYVVWVTAFLIVASAWSISGCSKPPEDEDFTHAFQSDGAEKLPARPIEMDSDQAFIESCLEGDLSWEGTTGIVGGEVQVMFRLSTSSDPEAVRVNEILFDLVYPSKSLEFVRTDRAELSMDWRFWRGQIQPDANRIIIGGYSFDELPRGSDGYICSVTLRILEPGRHGVSIENLREDDMAGYTVCP